MFFKGIIFSCALAGGFLLILKFSKAKHVLLGVIDGLKFPPDWVPDLNESSRQPKMLGIQESVGIFMQKFRKHIKY
jgi:hypothetical protein